MLKELPEDVIIHILSRVPTRHILRFKSVCKSWYALFQNPNFISKHFKNQSAISDPSFLFTPEKTKTPISTSDHTVGLILSDYSYKSIKIPIKIDVSKSLYVCGSCNGLIRLSILPLGSIILLWNPSTRVFKDLPISHVDHPRADHPLKVCLGFGFDDVVKDYKVLRILQYHRQLKQVEIYSLSTNSWKEIKTSINFIIHESACSVFLNGKFYWHAVSFLGDHNMITTLILCFDLHEEVFNCIMRPQFEFTGCIENNWKASWQVVAMNESLAAIGWLGIGSRTMFEVWVMKEYGGVSSWTKFTSFDLQSNVTRALGCGLKGEILLMNDNRQLVVYDPDLQRGSNLGNYGVAFSSQVFNHVGSLISIDGWKVATRTNLSSIVPDAFFVR
ncbi:putative F-box protein At3g20705 [Rutidosis leptorrhynchoides]|uniref:putative F-box protein At3g20705 n=1 Tax=Rutidosis leptorrhynchoides TaxID=125765 RepID=UPI003A99F9E6